MSSTPQSEFRTIDNIAIPVLPTAAEQFAFASSNLDGQPAKRAALKAVALFHPGAIRERKLAALELAYLELGEDYRLARPEQCEQALASYREIFNSYKDDNTVAPNALWHQGWILSTLQGNDNAGAEFFQQVISDYPEAEVENTPPPPWLSLKETHQTEELQPTKAKLRWADLARLELVRNSPDSAQPITIIEELQAKAPDNPLLGLMIKNLLERHAPSPEAEALATNYLYNIEQQPNTPEKVNLEGDLRDLLTAAPTGSRESVEDFQEGNP